MAQIAAHKDINRNLPEIEYQFLYSLHRILVNKKMLNDTDLSIGLTLSVSHLEVLVVQELLRDDRILKSTV